MLLRTLHHLKKTSFILIKPVRTMLICSPRSRLLAGETMKNPPRTVTVKQVKLSGHICSDDDKILLVRSITRRLGEIQLADFN